MSSVYGVGFERLIEHRSRAFTDERRVTIKAVDVAVSFEFDEAARRIVIGDGNEHPAPVRGALKELFGRLRRRTPDVDLR